MSSITSFSDLFGIRATQTTRPAAPASTSLSLRQSTAATTTGNDSLMSLIQLLLDNPDILGRLGYSINNKAANTSVTQVGQLNTIVANDTPAPVVPVATPAPAIVKGGSDFSVSTIGHTNPADLAKINAAKALSADLDTLENQFDVEKLDALIKGNNNTAIMQYLYKEINGWTVESINGTWLVTADDGRWGGPDKSNINGHNANVNSRADRMHFSALVEDSPEHFRDWDQVAMEEFYGYNSTRSDVTFANRDALIKNNDIFWHNASGTRGFVAGLMEQIQDAETKAQWLKDYGDSCYDDKALDLASKLQSQATYLRDVGKKLFQLSDMQATPYVIDFNGDGVATSDQIRTVGDNNMAWLAVNQNTDDAVLLNDVNGNGQIDSMAELVSARREDTVDGQQSLGELDDNGDGKVDAADKGFANLKLWFDKDGNGRVDAGELVALADKGVASFNVDYVENRDLSQSTGFMADEFGNSHRYTSQVNLKDGSSVAMTDIFFNQVS
ncbi:MAG: hypothetical protein KC476_01290 [Cyanobacteria bacterium HKST-UBA06]|nr:hypothetical protein [Cyanobacteria bacterium HKST-UBA06]